MTNRINVTVEANNLLGSYLRDRRTRLDPAALGFSVGRRRTPGLRREEVAQRANISPTWYTWLEQGRGGGPSADVLDRIARALMLTDMEREHLFLLGLGHPPEARYRKNEGVTPPLHPVLGELAFEYSTFAVDGRTDLSLLIYNPATERDAAKIAALIAAPPA